MFKRLFFVSFLFGFPVFAEPGFFRTNDNEIPDAIKKASKSVLRYVEILDEPASIPAKDYDKAISFFEQPGQSDFMSQLLLKILKTCRDEKKKVCEFNVGRGTASAFLAESSDTLFMARHSWSRWLAEKMQKFSGTDTEKFLELIESKPKVHLALYDSSHKLIFGGDGDEAHIDTVFFGQGVSKTQVWQKLTWLGQPMTDWVRIKLNRKLAIEPLSFATEPPKVDDKLYGIGFPNITKTRDSEFSQPDSNGFSQYITRGHLYSIRDFVTYASEFNATIRDALENDGMKDFIITHDVDLTNGMSGGPLLNELGQVVGNLSLKKNPESSLKDNEDRYFSGGANAISANAVRLKSKISPKSK